LRAAAAIGDDRLQKMSTGHVAPDRFTHGTSAQRVQWFTRHGLGDPRVRHVRKVHAVACTSERPRHLSREIAIPILSNARFPSDFARTWDTEAPE
jgi:hypothetical protein